MVNEQFLKVLVTFCDNTEVETFVKEDTFNAGYGLPAGYTQILKKEFVTRPVYAEQV